MTDPAPDPSPNFEREQWRAEIELRREELALKRREQDLSESDFALKRREAERYRASSPLVISLFAAALAGVGNIAVSAVNAGFDRAAEKSKAESARILEMIKTGDEDKAKHNLQFLIDTSLIEDKELSAKLTAYLAKNKAPVLAASSNSAPLIISGILPDLTKTPGATDPAATDADICARVWRQGDPPQKGGTLTYSQAARGNKPELKAQAFTNYGLTEPVDGGKSYELDHLVPLALGGRNSIENVWPESRQSQGFNAWVKDQLEVRMYNLICNPKPSGQKISLHDAQKAFTDDWTKAYLTYCTDDTECRLQSSVRDRLPGSNSSGGHSTASR